MSDLEYWEECISLAADECRATLTPEQLKAIAESVATGHENYGMAFYSPPASDRINDIEREFKQKISDLEKQHARYQENAEKAVKQALRQYTDTTVSIGEHGAVYRHGGRTEQIQ